MIAPVNLLESVDPKVSSPFSCGSFAFVVVTGLNEIPTRSLVIAPCAARLSVTVGIVRGALLPVTVCVVRSVGPMPIIPSRPVNPLESEATPMDCWGMTRDGDKVT